MSEAHWKLRGGRSVEGPPGAPRHEVVTTRDGALAMRDIARGEIMHPVVGPTVEAERLYVAQSRLRERLLDTTISTGPFVLFDAGLGAGSNALAARRVSEALADAPHARTLEIVSYDNDLGALEVALLPSNAQAFGLEGEAGDAGRALLQGSRHETRRTHWRLHHGELLDTLRSEASMADLVFWDPFSPRANPELWSVAAFTALRARCGPRCTLFTYAAATSVRSALLLAGFAVGLGAGTGTTHETTAAAVDAALLGQPLGPRWLERLRRSSAPFPADAPAGALLAIAMLPQFQP